MNEFMQRINSFEEEDSWKEQAFKIVHSHLYIHSLFDLVFLTDSKFSLIVKLINLKDLELQKRIPNQYD